MRRKGNQSHRPWPEANRPVRPARTNSRYHSPGNLRVSARCDVAVVRLGHARALVRQRTRRASHENSRSSHRIAPVAGFRTLSQTPRTVTARRFRSERLESSRKNGTRRELSNPCGNILIRHCTIPIDPDAGGEAPTGSQLVKLVCCHVISRPALPAEESAVFFVSVQAADPSLCICWSAAPNMRATSARS